MRRSLTLHGIVALLLVFMFSCVASSSSKPKNVTVKDSSGSELKNGDAKFDFGSVMLTLKSSETFTISFKGTSDLELTGTPMVEITGTGSSGFSVITPPTSPISSGSSTTFTIEFAPIAVEAYSASISIANSDVNENPFTFDIEGTGIPSASEINIMDSSANSIGAGAGAFDFGTCALNTPFTETFTIENLGTSDLNLTGTPFVSVSGTDAASFTIDDSMTTSPVIPGGSTTFEVSFTTTTPGGKTATISIDNDDSDENPYEFEIKGSGVSPYGWTKRIGGIGSDVGFSVATDSVDNVYLMGQYEETVNFAADFGSSDNKTYNGIADLCLTKISSTGAYEWTKTIGSTIGIAAGYAIAVDSADNVYITGFFAGTINFAADFGGSDSKTSVTPNAEDIFVTKINSNGSYGWTRQIGGDDTDIATSIAVDTTGNVYITGIFISTVDFAADFGGSDSKTSDTFSMDIFLTKITSAGAYGWTKQMGASGSDAAMCVKTDTAGNIYLTGGFDQIVDFAADFGGSDVKASNGDIDIFITKITSTGAYGWTKSMGGLDQDVGNVLVTDSNGDVIVTGYFADTVDFASDFGSNDSKTSVNLSYDIFVTKVTSSGAYGWTRQIGGIDEENSTSIITDSLGDIYMTGSFWDTVDFAADFGSNDSKTAGNSDIFVTKITSAGNYGWTKKFGGVGEDGGLSITSDSAGYMYVTGYFMNDVDFGADFGVSDSKHSTAVEDMFLTQLHQ